MIHHAVLVEELDDIVYQYLNDPARPGHLTGKISPQDLVSHVADYLVNRGVDIGFSDGSKCTGRGESKRYTLPTRKPLI